MGRIKVTAFAVKKKDCSTGNPLQPAGPSSGFPIHDSCLLMGPRSVAGKQGCAGVSQLWTLSTKHQLRVHMHEKTYLIKCIFKEIFCIKGIYLWFSHTNSSSYLMKVSVLIHENQYSLDLFFLRDGLWGNVNLDHYIENWVLWRPAPDFQVQRNTATSWAKVLILDQLERYFMYMFKYYLLFK